MSDFLPNRPNTNVDSNDFMFKEWFMSLWRYIRNESIVSPIQTASFTCDLDTFLYVIDTSAAAKTVTLPAASGLMGKKYCFIVTSNLFNGTVAVQAGDTLFTGATTIASNSPKTVISDGDKTWYIISNG